MSHRLPFWTTIITTLALGACLRNQAPEGALVSSSGPEGEEELLVTDLGGERAVREQDEDVQRTEALIPELVETTASVTREGDRHSRQDASGASGRTTSGAVIGGTAEAPVGLGKPMDFGVTMDATSADYADAVADAPMAMAEERRSGGSMKLAAPHRDSTKRKETERAPSPDAAVAGPGYYPPPVTPRPAPSPVVAFEPEPKPTYSSPTTTEGYTDYGINGFILAEKDRLSTFAIDVDTASYTMARRKLEEGYLPATSAVRVEEFVNYFPYEYARPERGEPFTVDFEASPSPFNPVNHIVRVGVQGKKVSFDERKAVHLTFLVDVSGSMRSADKLELVKKSLKMLTEELDDGDTIAIATYAGSTRVVLEPTPVADARTIMRSLDGLTAGGSTAMSSGIDLAYGLADRTYVPGSVNRVIVCSDGDANVGQTSHEALSSQIKEYARKGITLTTLGFGTGNYQDTMMERLANDGDGNYFYLDGEAEARRVLVDKLTGTLEVIAKDVKIQVDWNPGNVIAYRLIGYENRDVADVDFRNDKVDAGEIGAGHQVTALYEVALVDHPTGDLGTVRIRNKAPGPDAPAAERSYSLGVRTVKSSFDEGSDQYRIAFASAAFAEILRGSPHMSEVSLRDVAAIARSARRPEYSEDTELIELIERAAKLRGEGALSAR